jgi:C4-dicarboxylate-specific signal transduction histidine kinase
MTLWIRSFMILTVGLAAWLVVVVVFSRRLTQSLVHLDGAAQRIAAGDFSPIERKPMPTREFEDLQRAFDQMLRRFNETRTALDSQMGEERRIRQELQSLQRQVIRQERLAAVGQLVSGVAHEINNPLQAILGFAELLQMQADVPDSVKGDLVLIQKESARACGIIRNLALFARQQTGDAAPVRLADVSKSVAELRQRRLESEDIELRIEDSSKHHVLAVMTELQQVVLNFVVNAEQAIVMSKRLPGRITIRTRDDKDRVVLEVEDTGPGIPEGDEAKLFQPFFTTKPVGQGTGLGLSVSYGIIDSLGGHIGYRGAPAGGAIFYFDLPAAAVETAR